MIKFFKELISSFKEGIAEAKEEMATEAIEKEAANKETINKREKEKESIEEIDYTESFGTALGAPFRIITFGDWFTLFNISDDDEMYPIHLYTFGNYPKLEEHKNDFKKVLKRDFGITDKETCLEILSLLFEIGAVKKNDTILKSIEITNELDGHMWDMTKDGSKALLSAVLSHIVSASVDVGYIDKVNALNFMQNIILYVKEHCSNWETYASDFFIGENNIGLNNKIGKSYLKKYVGYLKDKKGSPWNNIPWKN